MKIFIINEYYPKDKVGGSELQCYLIAKYLAKLGHEIFYVALNNIKHRNQYEKEEGFSVIRLNKKSEFQFLLNKYKHDLCYIRHFGYLHWLLMIIKKYDRRTVFSISHVNDTLRFPEKHQKSLNPKKFLGTNIRNLYHYYNFLALRKVEKIISLTCELSKKLELLGLPSVVVKNSIEKVEISPEKFPESTVIWVANIKSQKRPELFIKLAEESNNRNVDFLMIGDIRDSRYKKDIEKAQKRLPNFNYLGFKDVQEAIELISKSTILVHTCLPEGFPNNFIQAWMAGVPTVTLSFDPDGVIDKHRLGFHSKNFEQFVKDVDTLLENKDLRNEMGENARKYLSKNHDIKINIKKFEDIFESLIQEKGKSQTKLLPVSY